MKESIDGFCYVCRKSGKVRNINLYTVGSEGTDLCHDCEMNVVEFLRAKARSAVRTKIEFNVLDDIGAVKARLEKEQLIQDERRCPVCGESLEKEFLLHWQNGHVENARGINIVDAFTRAGYSAGATGALDYFEEVK